mmetsp:Transcript_19465/g.30927  ORF Transcript_19465/g.30927 Transcript_19465/m.30927 type:complete len:282 (+) Transcript_19465:1347-2192(+)
MSIFLSRWSILVALLHVILMVVRRRWFMMVVVIEMHVFLRWRWLSLTRALWLSVTMMVCMESSTTFELVELYLSVLLLLGNLAVSIAFKGFHRCFEVRLNTQCLFQVMVAFLVFAQNMTRHRQSEMVQMRMRPTIHCFLQEILCFLVPFLSIQKASKVIETQIVIRRPRQTHSVILLAQLLLLHRIQQPRIVQQCLSAVWLDFEALFVQNLGFLIPLQLVIQQKCIIIHGDIIPGTQYQRLLVILLRFVQVIQLSQRKRITTKYLAVFGCDLDQILQDILS